MLVENKTRRRFRESQFNRRKTHTQQPKKYREKYAHILSYRNGVLEKTTTDTLTNQKQNVTCLRDRHARLQTSRFVSACLFRFSVRERYCLNTKNRVPRLDKRTTASDKRIMLWNKSKFYTDDSGKLQTPQQEHFFTDVLLIRMIRRHKVSDVVFFWRNQTPKTRQHNLFFVD